MFRHTTTGSGGITKRTSQLISRLFNPTYPGAHLSRDKCQSLAPRWVGPHLMLYAFHRAFVSRPDAPYSKPYKLQPYPELPRRPKQRSVDMSMQVITFQLMCHTRAHHSHQDQAEDHGGSQADRHARGGGRGVAQRAEDRVWREGRRRR